MSGLDRFNTHAVYHLINFVINGDFCYGCRWPQIDHFFNSMDERDEFVRNSDFRQIIEFFRDTNVDVELLECYFTGGDWKKVWKWRTTYSGGEVFIHKGIEFSFENIASLDLI